jgi:hypothetical protein
MNRGSKEGVKPRSLASKATRHLHKLYYLKSGTRVTTNPQTLIPEKPRSLAQAAIDRNRKARNGIRDRARMEVAGNGDENNDDEGILDKTRNWTSNQQNMSPVLKV